MKTIQNEKILIHLPSPMGDAIMCTPALRAIRKKFNNAEITFLAGPVVRDILQGTDFCDNWIEHKKGLSILTLAKELKQQNFTHAILFKNSFASALTVFLAKIPTRIGYSRESRGLLLTDKLYPPKQASRKFKPTPMVDYYIAIAGWVGAETSQLDTQLAVNQEDLTNIENKLPAIKNCDGPLIVIVPGGAFGPSKCWPSERFAKTADYLIKLYNATVVISVAPNPAEKKIAGDICQLSSNDLIDLGQTPLTLSQLKALFQKADLVISNDTGPRHIAVALKRPIVTLFGPNNPVWTETGYDGEIKIIADVNCAPCDKPICKKEQHYCMESITVEKVCHCAEQFLNKLPDSQTHPKPV